MHGILSLKKLEVGQQVLQHIRLIIECIDVLEYEDEEGRFDPARHLPTVEGVHVLELEIGQETLLLHVLGLNR